MNSRKITARSRCFYGLLNCYSSRGMLCRVICFGLLVITLVLTSWQTSWSQNAAQPAAQTEDATESDDSNSADSPIRKAQTEIYLLRDKDGNLVKVATNLTLEEYLRLYGERNNLAQPDAPPAFAFDQVNYQGQIKGRHAELDITIRGRVVGASADGWIRVPIGLKRCVLSDIVKHQGEGDFFLTWEENDGHVCWINAKEQSQHQFEMKVLTPIQTLSRATQFTIDGPRARSRFDQLTVSMPNAVVVNSGLRVAAQPAGENATRFSFDFAGGELQFGWQPKGSESAEPVTRFETKTQTRIEIHGPEQITARCDITVTGLGDQVRSFVIRLPTNFEVVNTPLRGFRMSVEADDEQTGVGQRVLVVSNQPVEEANVRLEARYRKPPVDSEDKGSGDNSSTSVDNMDVADMTAVERLRSAIDFGGFQVEESVRQNGTIDFVVDDGWTVAWETRGDIRRGTLPPDLIDGSDSSARFELFSNANSISGTLEPQSTELRIRPRFVYQVRQNEVLLESQLVCQYQGAGRRMLKADYAGWSVDQVILESDELVTLDDQINGDELQLAIQTPQALTRGQFTIRIRSRLPLQLDESGVGLLDLPCPIPTAISGQIQTGIQVQPSNVVLLPDDNIEVVPDPTALGGLVRDGSSDYQQWELPERDQQPLVYLVSDVGTASRFLGAVKLNSRQMLVVSKATISLQEREAQFRHRLEYNIAYAPIRHLTLDIPEVLADPKKLQVYMVAADTDQNRLLPWNQVVLADGETAPTGRTRIEVDLLADQTGNLDLLVQYSEQLPLIQTDATSDVNLEMVLPALNDETTLVSHQLTLLTTLDFDVESTDANWQPGAAQEEGEAVGGTLLVANSDTGNVGLSLKLRKDIQSSNSTIHRMWLQTVITEQGRRERAAIELHTNDSIIRVLIPHWNRVDQEGLIVSIDGQRVPLGQQNIDANGEFSLRVSAEPRDATYLLEFWYPLDSDTVESQLQVEFPSIPGTSFSGRCYWQLVTPTSYHVYSTPETMISEQSWRWKGWYFGRDSTLGQASLERWIGVDSQLALPGHTNRYLFSSIGSAGAFSISLMSRSTLLFIVSGVVLVIGLCMMYLPLFKHPASLMVVGTALLAVGLFRPELSILFIQSGILGVTLVILSRVVHGWVRDSQPMIAAGMGVAARADSRIEDASLLPLEGSTRATLPAVVSESASRAK